MTWRPTLSGRTRAERPQPLPQPPHAVPTPDKVLMAQAWLAVLDGLEGTLDDAGGRLEADPNDAGGRYRTARVLDGVRAIHDQALDMIASLGFRRHDETGIPFDPVVVERRPGDPAGVAANVDRIRHDLGWSANYDLRQMVESAWQAWPRR